MISYIWAQDCCNLIGNSLTNSLPWPKIPEDLHFFRTKTMGQIIVMGRKTFESFPNGALPGRTNVVLTSKKNIGANVITINDLREIKKIEQRYTKMEIFIIGGKSLFAAALPWAQRLYQTKISGNFIGDIHMVKINYHQYQKKSEYKILSSTGYQLMFNLFEKI